MSELGLKRKKVIETMKKGVDVLVVGGGITGAGVVNILSSLNLKCALIESEDFARGTSSRSSKLIHGGLRYLAHGNVKVVRQSVKERDYLLSYPHLVQKMRFIIPIDQYSWSKNMLRFGLWLYGMFSKSLKSEWNFKDEVVTKEPVLKNVEFDGAYVYYDAVTDDSRLVLNTLFSAKQAGAAILNYAKLVNLNFEGNVIKAAVVLDEVESEEFTVPFKIMVNATGPWIASIFEILENEYKSLQKLRENIKLSYGIHITVKRELFPITSAIAFRSHIDKRQIFIIPRNEVVLIGTTETYFEGNLDNPQVSEKDIEYLIESVKRYIRGISRDKVIGAYSGVRPLFGKGADLGKISREYKIIESGNVVHILGGKLTTYRIVSKKVAKLILKRLRITKNLKIPDLNLSYEKNLKDKKEEIIELLNGLNVSINEHTVQFAYDVLYESALHLDDVLWRREGYAIFSADLGFSKIEACMDVMRKLLNYDNCSLSKEKEEYTKSIANIQK